MVDSSGAEAKAERIMAAIAARIEETMPAVAAVLAASALSRTPTIDEEYDALMAEEGGSAAVPRSGGRSDDKDDRIRLEKPEVTYLENAVVNPLNVEVTLNSVAFGNLPFLEEMTTYRYTNVKRTGKDTHEQIEHEVGPYFFALEEGGSKTIVPVFPLLNGHKYRLRPVDDNAHPGFDSMPKTFASIPHNIFAPFALLAAAQETLKTALAELNGA